MKPLRDGVGGDRCLKGRRQHRNKDEPESRLGGDEGPGPGQGGHCHLDLYPELGKWHTITLKSFSKISSAQIQYKKIAS